MSPRTKNNMPLTAWNIDGFHLNLDATLAPRFKGDGALRLYTLLRNNVPVLNVQAREDAHSLKSFFVKEVSAHAKETYIHKDTALRKQVKGWANGRTYRRMHFPDLLIDLYNWAPDSVPPQQRNAMPPSLLQEGARLGMIYELVAIPKQRSRFRLQSWFILEPQERLELHPLFQATARNANRHLYLLEQKNGVLQEDSMHVESVHRQSISELARLKQVLVSELEKPAENARWGIAFVETMQQVINDMAADDLRKPYSNVYSPEFIPEVDQLNYLMKSHFPMLSWDIRPDDSGAPEDGIHLSIMPQEGSVFEIGWYEVVLLKGVTFHFGPKPTPLSEAEWLKLRLIVVQFAILFHRTYTFAERERHTQMREWQTAGDDSSDSEAESFLLREEREGWDEEAFPF